MGSQTKRLKNLRKLDEHGRWVPGKISELIHEFARPLLDATGAPRNIEDLRNVFHLATLCWNLPVYQRVGVPEVVEMERGFEETLDTVPESVAALLRRLIHDRKTKFAKIPFYIVAEVRGTTLDDATLYAEARQARS